MNARLASTAHTAARLKVSYMPHMEKETAFPEVHPDHLTFSKQVFSHTLYIIKHFYTLLHFNFKNT